MCSDGFYYPGDAVGECPDCGAEVNEDGEAVEGCYWSPQTCDRCGHQPCDGSC